MTETQKWQRCYKLLYEYGYSDQQIADLAGVTRVTIHRVRHGDWPHVHRLNYMGGTRIIDAVRQVQAKKKEAQAQLDLPIAEE